MSSLHNQFFWQWPLSAVAENAAEKSVGVISQFDIPAPHAW